MTTDDSDLNAIRARNGLPPLDGADPAPTAAPVAPTTEKTKKPRPPRPVSPDPDHLLTPDEVAKRLSVSLRWVYENGRRLSGARKVGHLLRFHPAEFEKGLLRTRLLTC